MNVSVEAVSPGFLSPGIAIVTSEPPLIAEVNGLSKLITMGGPSVIVATAVLVWLIAYT